MSLNLTITAACMLLLGATPAVARIDPPPPPSGIIVHLFGPNSVASNILPQPTAQKAAADTNAPPQATPDIHDVLHQMFITGDPNVRPGQSLPKGRQGG
ncbi:MAG: hypothetical protein POH28_01110 [Acidocella sp.]|nr:hypothetical protein [Acidocella sp.]